ncbi:MAG: Crp/Fnr family transcriptional regulator [Proteobacteria bacterium]|nr:Crp/Fnr family transcriptional regulator [Pseudomonadota bacterium]
MDLRQFDISRYLATLPLFQEVLPAELQRLATGCRLRRYARGESIFRVGMPCEEFHVAVKGQVKLFAISSAGQEKVVELVGPGMCFGEAVMFTDKPYILNAEALTDAIILSVGKAAVVREVEADPRFAMHMLGGISRRMHGLVRDVQAYALHTGMERVIGYLLHSLPEEEMHDNCNRACDAAFALNVSLPVSKATIASRLSITPEYFSRVLHDLEEAGLIRRDKRDIHIPDVARLASYTLQ